VIEFEGEKYQIFDAHTHWSQLMSKILKPVLELLSTNEILDLVFSKWKELKKTSNSKRDLKINAYAYALSHFGIDKAISLPVFGFDQKFSIECGQKKPDQIIGFGIIKPREKKIEETFQFLINNKVKGIKLHPQYSNFNVKTHQKEILHTLEFMADQKMIALFHTGSHYKIRDLALILKKVDNLKVILGHMGLSPQVDQAIKAAIDNPNIYLETSGQTYDYMIKYAINHEDIGIKRVLFGTDFPTLDPTVEMMKILTLPISNEEKRMLFWDNTHNLMSS
jgi:predicted TIM-barrel fold metal-dependent hydrolase